MLPLPAGREASPGVGVYERHRPERTLLDQLVETYYRSQFGVGVVSISQFTIAAYALAQFAFAYSLIAQFGIYIQQGHGQMVKSLGELLGMF